MHGDVWYVKLTACKCQRRIKNSVCDITSSLTTVTGRHCVTPRPQRDTTSNHKAACDVSHDADCCYWSTLVTCPDNDMMTLNLGGHSWSLRAENIIDQPSCVHKFMKRSSAWRAGARFLLIFVSRRPLLSPNFTNGAYLSMTFWEGLSTEDRQQDKKKRFA